MPNSPESIETGSVDLKTLVYQSKSVGPASTVDEIQKEFALHDLDFIAIVEDQRPFGICARRDLAQALGSRFGFALNAHLPAIDCLMANPLRIVDGTPVTEVFKAAGSRNDREFHDDIMLVDSLGHYLGMIAMRTLTRLQMTFLLGNIERVEASRREIREKNQKMEAELRMAREVQLAMLPQQAVPGLSPGPSLSIAHRFQPAGGVSGDFFAILRLSDSVTGILICDVMGHGVRSALVTAMVRATIEELRPYATDPGVFLTRLNQNLTSILRQTSGLIFVTAAYATVDISSGKLRYAQAGHPTPFRWKGLENDLRPIQCTPDQAGPALGLIDDFEFTTCEENFRTGDRIVMFTDGLLEAANNTGEEFGDKRFVNSIVRHSGHSLDESLDALISEVLQFGGGGEFADDVCVVAAELVAG